MNTTDQNSIRTASEVVPGELDPTATVVVPTGGGDRFHRPDGLGFETACKTTFDYPIRKTSVDEAVSAGFTPCRKTGCFDGREE